MRSLALKLTLAFLVVSLTGAALAAAVARWTTGKAFDLLVLELARSNFIEEASAYYQEYGSWEGFRQTLRPPQSAGQAALPPPGPPIPRQPADQPPRPRAQPAPPPVPRQPARLPPPPPFVLVDQTGEVVVPGGAYRPGDYVPPMVLATGIPIEVEGDIVGTVLTTGEIPTRSAEEDAYIERTNRALLVAALGATVVALVLGLVFTRTLTHPLRELTAAVCALSQGELSRQVVVRSRDEVGELATAFNQMSADLAHAHHLRRQMTADIAHDLRTPLMVIGGYIESMRDSMLAPSAERFETMYAEVQHLQHLVEDLRTLALADAGELPLHLDEIAPHVLLHRVAAAYELSAAQRQIALVVQVDAEVPVICVDVERMMQVLRNLMSNALRYTPARGQIILAAQAQDSHIHVFVRDTGKGIAPEVLPHIFERFYRGDTAREQQSNETGLGLAIARSIVQAHGGVLQAESQPGHGATFIITLPRWD